jgi:GTPase
MIFELLQENQKLKREDEYGNIEYKLRLDSKDLHGITKLVSQMVWRLNQGKELYDQYIAHYVLGVKDNGEYGNMTLEDLQQTIAIFKQVVERAKLYVEKENF